MMLTIKSNERGSTLVDAIDAAQGKARDELNAKLAELDRERTAMDAIAATVGGLSTVIPNGWEMRVFPRIGIYGVVARVKLEPQLYESLRDGSELQMVTRREALALARTVLQPVPCVLYKDSCTSIRPLASLTDKHRELATSIVDVFGIWWKYDPMDERKTESLLTYAKDERSGAIVQVEISCFPSAAHLIDTGERDSRGRITRHRWGLTNAPAGPHAVRYASGSRDKPGQFLILFDMLSDHPRIGEQLEQPRSV